MTKALSRQRAAVSRIRMALRTYHSAVRTADRAPGLYPRERDQAKAEVKAKAEAEIAAAKQDFAAGMAQDRATHARYVDEPSGQDLERRRYWQTAAQADLAGITDPDAVATLINNLIAQGARAQAAEYLRVARPLMRSDEHHRLTQATLPAEAKKAQSMAAALDRFEEVMAGNDGTGIGLDYWIESLTRQAGTIHPDERTGTPSDYDDRALLMLADRAEASAVEAGNDAFGGGGGDE